MDAGTLYISAIIILALGIMALYVKKEVSFLFAFIGGVLGLLFFSSLNTDGSITNAYGFNGSFSTSTVGIWPFGYILILFTVLDFGIGIILAADRNKF